MSFQRRVILTVSVLFPVLLLEIVRTGRLVTEVEDNNLPAQDNRHYF